MGLTPASIAAVFVIYFVGFFIKGLAGFGDPLVTSPLLSMFLENRLISPNNLLLSMPINGYIAWKNRKAFSMKLTLSILGFIMLGVIPGTLLLKFGSSWVLKAGLGVLILAIGVEMLTRGQTAKAQKHQPVVLALVCVCSGITAGLYGINLFFVAYLERMTESREAFRGNICFVFFFETVWRLAVYIVGGVITKEVLLLTAVSLPGMLAGFLVGSRVDKKLSEKVIRNIVIAVFMLGGVSVLLKALILKT